jgi:7,8-dihydropterin-6-yl-methyl-4-(beta-D-ribofuranosyl)aminobenzene 5'-phosphate synthase
MWQMKLGASALVVLFALVLIRGVAAQEPPARVTIIYDAFGQPSALKRGFGYSALVEYAGKRILFDTGADVNDFASNAKILGVDLTRLDFAVLSHRHGDHTSGLNYVLKVNPGVKIYTPVEPANFGTPTPPGIVKLIKRRVDTAPEDMHYFDGKYPERFATGTPWPGANFAPLQELTEVAPGFYLFPIQSDVAGTKEMYELSMAVKTPRGLVVIVGCSHPGIERILAAASKIDARLYTVFGGLHQVDVPDPDVSSTVSRFRDQWKMERVAAGHCTGEFAFSELNRVFGPKFDHAGVGAVIPLPR